MLSFNLSRSALLTRILIAAHSSVIIILFLLPLQWLTQLLVGALILSSLLFYLPKDALRVGNDAIVGLQISQNNGYSIETKSGTWKEIATIRGEFVSEFLVIIGLEMQHENQVRKIVLLPDALNPESFRQLRVWLRWQNKQNKP